MTTNFTTTNSLLSDKQVLETEIEDIEDDESDGTSDDQPELQKNDENGKSSVNMKKNPNNIQLIYH